MRIPNETELRAWWIERARTQQEAARFENRDLVMSRLPDSQRCMLCLRYKCAVHRRKGGEQTCDSCNRRIRRKRLPRRFYFQRHELIRCRDGLQQSHFARMCGWSQPRQSFLEQQESVNLHTAVTMGRVLQAMHGIDAVQMNPLWFLLRCWNNECR